MPVLHRLSLAPLAVAAASLALLAGCSLLPGSTPATSPGDGQPTASTDDTSTPSSEPSAAGLNGSPISAKCADLISAEQIYAYNPNIVALEDFTPDAGTPASTALALDGIACRYQNQTSGDNIDLSVAHLDSNSFAQVQASTTGDLVDGFGDSAFFSAADSAGTLTVFQDTYWVTLSSPAFLGADDATELVTSVLDALSS